MANIYYADDAPIDVLKDKTVAVIGYGSQGHAHSQNLRDSGINVVVAELEGTDNFNLAKEHGFEPTDIATALAGATLIVVTVPDEVQAIVYKGDCPESQGGSNARFLSRIQYPFQIYCAPQGC